MMKKVNASSVVTGCDEETKSGECVPEIFVSTAEYIYSSMNVLYPKARMIYRYFNDILVKIFAATDVDSQTRIYQQPKAMMLSHFLGNHFFVLLSA